jgi:hypothetical protein
MTDQAAYQPLPMPHGRVRPAPPPLLVQEGALPPDLVEQARARQAEAEFLVLPREAEPHLQDGDPSLAIYNDSDMMTVEVLRRSGVRADYLAEHRKVVSQFAATEWIDFAVAVAENISAAGVVGIAGYLIGRIRKARQSKDQLQLDLTVARPDGTYVQIRASDTDAGVKALAETLATITTDPTAKEALLRLAAGADPSIVLKALKPQAAAADAEGEAGDQDDTHED